MKDITPGLLANRDFFSDLSSVIGATSDGEILCLPKKNIPYTPAGYGNNNRDNAHLAHLAGKTGEMVANLLLPGSSHTGSEEPYDITMPSAYDTKPIYIEVKTAQTRNRGVIRPRQLEGYRERAEDSNVYYMQIFYQTRSGKSPCKIGYSDFTKEFFPTCMFIFPVSFIIYLINTIQPTGQKTSTQFYGLTHFRARKLFEIVDGGLDLDEVVKRYRARVFTTTHLPHNTEAKLHIIDHMNMPHILGHMGNLIS